MVARTRAIHVVSTFHKHFTATHAVFHVTVHSILTLQRILEVGRARKKNLPHVSYGSRIRRRTICLAKITANDTGSTGSTAQCYRQTSLAKTQGKGKAQVKAQDKAQGKTQGKDNAEGKSKAKCKAKNKDKDKIGEEGCPQNRDEA